MTTKEKLQALAELKDPSLAMQRILADKAIAEAVIKLEMARGVKGDDGYTPMKGVDYFTDDEIGQFVEYIQSQVKNGKDGVDGKEGKPGRDGITPTRLIDYWTPEDQIKIVKDVLKQIPKPKDGVSPDESKIVSRVMSEYEKIHPNTEFVTVKQLTDFLRRGGFRGGGGSGGGSLSLPIITDLGGGESAMYDQSANLFNFGIKAAFDGYSVDGFSNTFTGSIFGNLTTVGGTTNQFLVGYLTFGPGGNASMNGGYDVLTDEAQIGFQVQTLAGTQASIDVDATPLTTKITFYFGGSDNYEFPNTQPTPGTVMGYTASHTLGWVPNAGGGLTIGNSITGGTANRILYENNTNTLQESADLVWKDLTGEFSVSFASSVHLFINPGSQQYYIGDGGGTGNTTLIEILDGTPMIRNWVNGKYYVERPNAGPRLIDGDTTTFTLYMGDVGNVANKTNIQILDSLNAIYIQAITNGSGTSGLVLIGDGSNLGNRTMFEINDFAKQTFVQTDGDFGVQTSAGGRFIDIQMGSGPGTWSGTFGDSGSLGNKTKIQVIDNAQTVQAIADSLFKIYNSSNVEWFRVDTNNKFVSIGDVGNAVNKTNFVVNDNTKNITSQVDGHFYVNNSSGQRVADFNTTDWSVKLGSIDAGNGTVIFIDDVNQLITLGNVPTYADDSAATTAGLTTGQLYKTTTGGITSVNIVP